MKYTDTEYREYICRLKLKILSMLENGHSGHIGGSLSCIDALAILYHDYIKGTSNKFVFSKGHCELAIYSVLIEEGIIPNQYESMLKCFGSMLQGHPSKNWIEGVDYSGGSLGQGLSFATGMAVCGLENGFKVYCMLGDGELQEGQIYEAILSASNLKLHNLCVLVDCNGLKLEGPVPTSCTSKQQAKMWSAIGWQTKIINGHSIIDIQNELSRIQNAPKVIFLETIKGNGVSFMENNPNYHGVNLPIETIQCAKNAIVGGYNG